MSDYQEHTEVWATAEKPPKRPLRRWLHPTIVLFAVAWLLGVGTGLTTAYLWRFGLRATELVNLALGAWAGTLLWLVWRRRWLRGGGAS